MLRRGLPIIMGANVPSFSNQSHAAFFVTSAALSIVGAVWFVPFLRTIGVSSWRDAGLDNPIRHWRQGVREGRGSASLALVAGLAVITGVRSLDLDHPRRISETSRRSLRRHFRFDSGRSFVSRRTLGLRKVIVDSALFISSRLLPSPFSAEGEPSRWLLGIRGY